MSFSTAAFSDSFGVGFDRVAPPVVVAPVIEGLEYTLLSSRFSYVVPESKLGYTMKLSKLHFAIKDEDG